VVFFQSESKEKTFCRSIKIMVRIGKENVTIEKKQFKNNVEKPKILKT